MEKDESTGSRELLAHPNETRVARITRFQSLSPGTYWRVCDPEALTALGKQATAYFRADTVYLLQQVRNADDAPHSVVVLSHPGDGDPPSEWRFLVDPFLRAFAYAPDGASVREREIAAHQQRITEQQGEIDRLSRDPKHVMARLVHESEQDSGGGDSLDQSAGLPAAETGSRSVGDLVHADQQLLARQLENSRAIAEKQASLLSSETQILQSMVTGLTPYFAERARAARASVSDALAHVEKIQQGLATLSLYTGEDVQVIQHARGPGAAATEPLTLRQRLLYMDEESLINVAEGGADFEDLDRFMGMVSSDAELRDRVIPEARCVVAMQFRRHARRYGEDPVLSAMRNAINKQAFLLVRDGENYYTVHSPLDQLQRLFPTRDEADEPFRGVDGDTIRVDDIRYARAKSQSEQHTLHYKRVLILLWGLYDREDLFGRFEYERSCGGRMNFISAQTQEAVFRFVYDDEPGQLLGERGDLPGFEDYVREKNLYLRSGSRVACYWDGLLTAETAPACVREYRLGREYHSETVNRPESGQVVQVVERRHEELHVRPWVSPTGEPGDRDRFRGRVHLTGARVPTHDLTYLCLDDVRPEDLDYYIHNRRERENYLRIVPLLAAARDALRTESAVIREFESQVRSALADAGALLADDKVLHEAVRDALRAWRVERRGSLPPPEGSVDRRKAMEQVVAQLWWQFSEDARRRRDELEALCAAEGRVPLRWVVSGLGALGLYVTPADSELDTRLDGHPWVQRWRLAPRKTKVSIERRKWTQIRAFDPSERVIHEWPAAAEWAAHPVRGYVYEDVDRVFAAVRAARTWLDELAAPGTNAPSDWWSESFEHLKRRSAELSRDIVRIPDVAVPVGFARGRLGRHGDPTQLLVVLQFDQKRMLHWIGAVEERRRLETWVEQTYLHGAEQVKRLRAADRLSVGVRWVELTHRLATACEEWPVELGDSHHWYGNRNAANREDFLAVLSAESTPDVGRMVSAPPGVDWINAPGAHCVDAWAQALFPASSHS